jgi:hypothetical protein
MSLRKSLPGSPLLAMRSDCQPYVVALGSYSPKRIHQSRTGGVQHAMARLRRLIGSGKFFRAASLKGRKQPTGLVVLRELRVFYRWTHDPPKETTSIHSSSLGLSTKYRPMLWRFEPPRGVIRPAPGLAERWPLCTVCVRGCAGIRQGRLGSFM